MNASFSIDHEKLWFEQQVLTNGETMIICRQDGCESLLGFVWGRYKITATSKRIFSVMGSFVVEWSRRQGVRTAINEHLFKHYKLDYITTPGATRFGKAFMVQSGYEMDEYGQWVLSRKQADLFAAK